MSEDSEPDLDLDIDNYNLEEILALFELTPDYKFEDLKHAFVNYVAPLHPDKSGLPSDYFIFYRKAYGVLINLYKTKTSHVPKAPVDFTKYVNDYKNEFKEFEETNRVFAEKLLNADNFNADFNKLFEDTVKQADADDADGYEDWLRGNRNNERITNYDDLIKHRNQDIDQFKQDIRQMTMDEFKIEFEQRRAEMIAGNEIISRDNIYGAITAPTGHTNLINGPIGDYSSANLFGSGYQDLKKAHTDTLIAVDPASLSDRFMRTSDYERFLQSREIGIEPMNKEDAEKYLNQQSADNEQENIRNTFKLMQQQEQQQKLMEKIWGKLKQITDK